MEKLEKNRFVILTGLILIGLFLRIWTLNNSPNLISNNQVVLAIFGVMFSLIVYKIGKIITKSTAAGLFSATLSIFLPLYDSTITDQVSHTLALGFFLFTLLGFISIKTVNDWKVFLPLPIIFAFLHFYSLILIPIFILYYFAVRLENKKLNKAEKMFMLSSSLLVSVVFIFFTSGIGSYTVISAYLEFYYTALAPEIFNISNILELVGTIPIYIGFLGAYFGLLYKRKSALLFISAFATIFLLIITNAIAATLGLPYFTYMLAILSGFTYIEIERLIKKSKLKNKMNTIAIIIFAIALVFGILNWVR